jgi:anti-sigma B factor antagonist
MDIVRRDIRDVTILDLSGKLMGGVEAASFQRLIKELIADGRTKIVLNLAALDWINSTGLGILISGYTSVRNAGGALRLANVAERIMAVLKMTKLLTVFETSSTEEEALAAFRGR